MFTMFVSVNLFAEDSILPTDKEYSELLSREDVEVKELQSTAKIFFYLKHYAQADELMEKAYSLEPDNFRTLILRCRIAHYISNKLFLIRLEDLKKYKSDEGVYEYNQIVRV